MKNLIGIGNWVAAKDRFSIEEWAQRSRFFSIQTAKAGLGALLALAFVGLVGRPDAAEGVAVIGLFAPGVLAALAFTDIAVEELEWAALAIFAALDFSADQIFVLRPDQRFAIGHRAEQIIEVPVGIDEPHVGVEHGQRNAQRVQRFGQESRFGHLRFGCMHDR
jgi:hypothetical protein